jgi:YebC/PmpR family DNA-binding regulatory protein
MPGDVVSRHIKRASGEVSVVHYDSVTYEGYGIGGVAVIVQALTDNKTRTAGEVRHIFDKYGGALGAQGCVAFMFATLGVIELDASKLSIAQDEFVLRCLEYDVLDIVAQDDVYIVYTDAAKLADISQAMQDSHMPIISAQVDKVPDSTVQLTVEQLARFYAMIDKFEDNDDVQAVYYNCAQSIE